MSHLLPPVTASEHADLITISH